MPIFNDPFPAHPGIVGTIHSPTALKEAASLPQSTVDFLEWRLDCLETPDHFEPARFRFPHLPAPLLLTIRHPLEGGQHHWPDAARMVAFTRLLPYVAAIDLELRSTRTLRPVIAAAANAHCPLIISCHDFTRTPALSTLQRKIRAARMLQPALIKIACTLQQPADLLRLTHLQLRCPHPLALMGMGQLGRASRLILAGLGSRLNYAHLGAPQVPGQWHVTDFARTLHDLALRPL